MREPIKILFVCRNSLLGGGEIALYQFLSRIDRTRFRPVVVTSSKGPLVNRLEQIHVPVSVIPVNNLRSLKEILLAVWRLKQLVQAEQIDLINSYPVNLATCLLAWSLRLPLIIHVHTVDRLRRLDTWCFRLPCNIVAVCEAAKKNLVDSGVLAKKIQVIPNGIEVAPNPRPLQHPTIREEFSIDPDAKIVGYLGRIAEGKGIHFLIEAAPAILSKHPKTIFLVVGQFQDGERQAAQYRERLVALCKKFQIEDHVLFCGFRDDIDSLMQQIDILALPSQLEAFPMTILEAMASGKPVVAAQVGGVPELLTEETGIMVPPGDPRGLAAGIIGLLDHPKRAQELGERARERAKQFPMAETVRKLEDYQLKSLNGKKTSVVEHERFSLIDYYLFGITLGLKAFLRGDCLSGMKKMINPIDYWRCVEVPAIARAVSVHTGEKILDLASAKLLALYLAVKHGAIVYATDIQDYFMSECERFREMFMMAGALRGALHLGLEDGRALSFPNEFFDKIYSLSVLEHIPEDGDTKTIKELTRVLKNGGILTITVPYCQKYFEEYIDPNVRGLYQGYKHGTSKVFFSRFYDQDTLEKRLINPSHLTVLKQEFYAEGRLSFFKYYQRIPYALRILFYPLHLPAAMIFIRKRDRAEMRQVGVAHIVFQRQG